MDGATCLSMSHVRRIADNKPAGLKRRRGDAGACAPSTNLAGNSCVRAPPSVLPAQVQPGGSEDHRRQRGVLASRCVSYHHSSLPPSWLCSTFKVRQTTKNGPVVRLGNVTFRPYDDVIGWVYVKIYLGAARSVRRAPTVGFRAR